MLNPTPVPPAFQNQSDHNQQLLMGPTLVYPTNKNVTVNTETHDHNRIPQLHALTQHISQPSQQTNSFIDIDNSLNDQSTITHNHPVTSLTFSPILTETLNQNSPHQFIFNSSTGPHLKQQINPPTRLIKHNPHHKPTRTENARTGFNPDPTKHVPNPDQSLPDTMETQTEKKRRREEEEKTSETSTETQHFLTAGPGSQACRDQ
jgi:hypothetical protein